MSSSNAMSRFVYRVFINRQHISLNLARDSVFEIVRGRTRDLSLVYAQNARDSFYSFLNFGWGFVADVDIESEKYR